MIWEIEVNDILRDKAIMRYEKEIEKPARYMGGEWNAVKKDWEEIPCHFALSLPDVYEVGMSNLGLAILYEILNRREDTWAERVYAPWQDMEALLREKNMPLSALESGHHLKEFDLWGFSLQYEMIYSNVLNMLDLAGIPLKAAERAADMPFIVGGGPCVYNVEPVADFFDFFIVGEGEEIIGEVAAALIAWKGEGKPGGRQEFLGRLLKIPGIYVPSFYEPHYDAAGRFRMLLPKRADAPTVVHKRVVRDLDAIPTLEKPIVPYLGIVHDRLMLELFRGCSRGCRFCQAGMCYRPVRERRPDKLRTRAGRMAVNTGYDEMSLTSLSSADYSCLPRLIDELTTDFHGRKISLSLPSLRIDSFSVELASRLQQVRKSGLTFAPEAGTQRLRDVINKGVTEENLLTACGAAFREGWRQVKLYFMLGLPTETDEDIIGIGKLAQRVAELYRQVTGKGGVKITVSVSCFVPKPYTPFQWFGQISLAEFTRRQMLLKDYIKKLPGRAITYNYHDAKLSTLEGVIARGDRRLAKVILRAWQKGAKFDGWSDLFKYDVWQEALSECDIKPQEYNERSRDLNEPLPWEITSPGVSKEFLQREWRKALAGELTADCRRGRCADCGVCPTLQAKVIDYASEEKAASASRLASVGKTKAAAPANTVPTREVGAGGGAPRPTYLYRCQITKEEPLRYLSHLDYAALFARAIERAALPIAYSAGFNPHPKLAFASALSVGVTSSMEYFDLELVTELTPREVKERLNGALPSGAKIIRIKLMRGKQPALMAMADLAKYEARVPYRGAKAPILAALAAFNQNPHVIYRRVTPKKQREINVKEYLREAVTCEFNEAARELCLQLAISITPTGSVKPAEILAVLGEEFALPVEATQARIQRLELTAGGKNLLDM
ncbi:MAG: TIGR03960 family B12-binding radical SAM protein [Selenomonadaceae bacterium]|nr:TIGR03960 family B12-binding radical SAM protein [Selenomonadaceae bacterium]